jgi:hypothetical protein
MGSSRGSIIVREGLLRFNNAAALLTWMALRYLAGYDFEYHKRI